MRMSFSWACIAMTVIAGCTSFRTTALYRCDNDSVVREQTNQKLKGIPVKLKVPSHVAVEIYEQQVLLAKSAGTAPNVTTEYKLVSFTPPQLLVETELIYTDKVFLVDFKRPAAGILDLKESKMDDQQYFSQIQAEVTERTINDINTSLNTLQPAVAQFKPTKATPTTANTPAGQGSADVGFQKSVVAYQRFDISEPDWEYRLQDFVNCQLNRCGGCPLPLGAAAPAGTSPPPLPAAARKSDNVAEPTTALRTRKERISDSQIVPASR